MRLLLTKCACLFLIGFGGVACVESTGPRTGLVESGPPNFVAMVTQNTHETGRAPSGFQIDQYAIWVSLDQSPTPNAGVLISARQPVFLRMPGGVFFEVTPAAIKIGQRIEVWHDGRAFFGAVQAPPDSPGYSATQIVITP